MRGALTPPFLAAALVLCVAGVAKLRSRDAAATAMASIGVPVDAQLVRCFAICELALGAWCLVAPGPANAAALACVYSGFAGLTLLLARRRAACGCFGGEDAPASGVQSLLSATLALVGVLATVLAPHGLGWILGHDVWFVAVLVLGCAGAGYGIVAAYTELPRAWGAWSAR